MVGLCVHVWCSVLFLSLSCPACCVFVSRDSRLAFPVWIMPAHVACVETVEVLSRQESSPSVLDRIPAEL